MEFVHKRPGWPNFRWSNEALAQELAAVRHRQGRHLGKVEGMGFELRDTASVATLTDEVVSSSAIENEHFDPEAVRTSIARRLGLEVAGLPVPGREVEGVVEMMLDATQNYDAVLTADRLFDWHAGLFPSGRSGIRRITVGAWRTHEADPMRVISGHMGREKTHLIAPTADRLHDEMQAFLQWFNSPPKTDPVLKAAIAHFWLVTIHPFEDGNGRIARAVGDMALSRADETKDRFYSMSSAIMEERSEYYNQLESAQRGDLDITDWLVWFLGCLDRTIEIANGKLTAVLSKSRFWEQVNQHPVNARQRTVLNRMLDDFKGHLTTSKYAKLAHCSNDTALRDIRELLGRDVIVKNEGGGRSTSYRLAPAER
jgi:Fic family protein